MQDSSFFDGDSDGGPTHEDSVDTASGSGSGGHTNPLEDLVSNIAYIVYFAELFEALVANPETLRAFGSME